jgi:hypothetical protein
MLEGCQLVKLFIASFMTNTKCAMLLLVIPCCHLNWVFLIVIRMVIQELKVFFLIKCTKGRQRNSIIFGVIPFFLQMLLTSVHHLFDASEHFWLLLMPCMLPRSCLETRYPCNASFNKKYWEELIAYFPFTRMGVFCMTSGKKFGMYS